MINRKYKLQQMFEALSLSLNLFSALVNGPVNDGLFEVSPDLNQSLLQFCFACTAFSCKFVE